MRKTAPIHEWSDDPLDCSCAVPDPKLNTWHDHWICKTCGLRTPPAKRQKIAKNNQAKIARPFAGEE